MSELTSVLDALAVLDLDQLAGRELLDLTVELATAANRMQAVLCRTVRAAATRDAHRGDAALTMKAWLLAHCRLSPADATAIVTTGRRLEQLPATADAFAAGHITAAHAKVITRAV